MGEELGRRGGCAIAIARAGTARRGMRPDGPTSAAPGIVARRLPSASRPFAALLRAWLEPRAVSPARAAIACGPGALAAARAAAARPATRHRQIFVRAGDGATDELLAALTPALLALLDDLTDRQREVAWLLLVEGRRRAEIAARLGISRPTVSVMVDRAHLAEIGALVSALDDLLEAGRTQSDAPATAARR